jgi:hypothetical protein
MSDMCVKAMILKAGTADTNNNQFTEECLKKMAEKNDKFVYEDGVLWMTMPIKELDPDAAKILEDNFWDLV